MAPDRCLKGLLPVGPPFLKWASCPWLGTVWPPTPLGARRLTQGISLLSRIAPFSFYFLQNRVGVQIPLSLICV